MINAYAAKEPGGKLEKFEYDPGELASHDVEIDVESCGICHSDLSMLDNEWGISEYPFVPGHEVVGTINAVGEHVTSLKVGQRVGLGWHAGYCNSCGTCESGDQNLCSDATMTIGGRHGGFADKVRAQATAVVPIPDGIDPQSAGPLFCGGITVFNPLVQFDIKPTSVVGVVGIGGLGHLALQFLNAWGCKVVAFTSSESKKKEALELGAHDTLNSRDEDELKAAAGKFDLIISTVNVKLDWNLYLSTLAPKGRLHFVGATLEPLDIGAFNLIGGQRSVSGSPVGSPATIKTMLDFAALHDIAPVTETFKFDEVNEAVQRLRDGKAHYRVVLTK
ncbi:NAD(P)-dependent alcohol dehydrogenase [Alteromonas sp. CI.11.F.A3]|uniref:NADPH-dependent aldehyde reductase Ahr n=1 Tax=unclassified Alteromonas TaxID=2614992 RepID=UPI001B39F2D5|nr:MULTISPECIES: NAD(P)-dependent alcohol dehydrogenase [unclassified Alteromonas]MBQ4828283.1 NAD(P)-dependent alcohol dehydrogenase [Alteromonas sp. MMG017]WOI36208.1 NAD(P)-dependent alcohol dehydrogenase [Alteromonas sp. CI.11.F.A3]